MVAEAIDRVIAEYCAGKDSKIGKLAPADCKVIRLTEEDDLTTEAGLEKALQAVRLPNCLLWISMPCTGGHRGRKSTKRYIVQDINLE